MLLLDGYLRGFKVDLTRFGWTALLDSLTGVASVMVLFEANFSRWRVLLFTGLSSDKAIRRGLRRRAMLHIGIRVSTS